MAKKNDKAFGLLILVGLAILVLSKIFEFVMDNILIVGIIAGSSLVIFGIFKYNEHQEVERQNERNVQNTILRSIKEKYTKAIDRIDERRKKILFRIEQINNDLENYQTKSINSLKIVYDPVKAISNLNNVLKKGYTDKNKIWDLLYDKKIFTHPNPKIEFEKKINEIDLIDEPQYFQQKGNLKVKRNNHLAIKTEQDKIEYNQTLKSQYNSAINEIHKKIESLTKRLEKEEQEWSAKFQHFENKKNLKNYEIDRIKSHYFKKEKKGIISFYSKFLTSFSYDPNFQKSVEIDFNDKTNVLIIEYLLPSIEHFPNIKEMRYIKTRNEFKEINFTQRELYNIYDDVIYRIVLDLINIVFQNDVIDSIESVVFNGWSNAINKATGLYNKACILSVFCEKIEFLKINLSEVEPKECFKSLKGISANKISHLTPIKPIISIEKSDSRFVPSKEIGIDSSTNLASMNWEDFEHLIREIFEQEFSTNGGEVKVTQSSRDGGVDAIAFDPDPIRGGKIVIQAKRYTNIVGVSSVRDLYGTVMNEGATKGILVTTSDYGSDSFKFAKDKPITLINGGNLLYLVEKHGYNARINLKEAKEQLKQQSTNHKN